MCSTAAPSLRSLGTLDDDEAFDSDEEEVEDMDEEEYEEMVSGLLL